MDTAALRRQHSIQLWHLSGGVALVEDPLEPGPWMDTTAAALLPLLLATGGREIRHQTPAWAMHVVDRQVEMLPGKAIPASAYTVLFPTPEERVALSALWYWRQRKVREFWFYELDGWRQADGERVLARRLYRRVFRRLVDRLVPTLPIEHEQAEANFARWLASRHRRSARPEAWYRLVPEDGIGCWHRWIEQDNRAFSDPGHLPADRPRRVTQYTGSLFPGGAERQLCNLSLGLAQRTISVQVLTSLDPTGAQGHYAGLLQAGGVPARVATAGRAWAEHLWTADDLSLLQGTPATIRQYIFRLTAELNRQRSDILHCWLDQPNIIGGVAGLLAGVPRILLSTRNYNPTHFPRLLEPYMQRWYQLLARSRRVHFLANSHAGAESYAEWIGIPVERIHVVFNGLCFDHFQPPTAECRLAARKSFGLDATQRVVCGIFRLDVEKRPEVFLEVVRRVAERVENLRALLAGTGPLEPQVRATIKRHRLGGCVQLLGRRQDVEQVLLAADVLLLTSTHEGCPNVALEAQYLGVPVVATATGGTPDAVGHGRTGYLAPVDDVAGLAEFTVRLLADADLRSHFSAAGRGFVSEAFSLNQMVELSTEVYRHLLGPPGFLRRVVTPRSQWLSPKSLPVPPQQAA